MKGKLFLFFALMCVSFANAQYPSVGILGAATSLGWSGNQPDIAMETTDGIHYTLNNMPLYSGGLKFRQDNSWPLNWGSTEWPAGTGVQDQGGMDVPVQVGVYDITFNLETKAYSFTYKFPVIGIRGAATAVDWGSANGDILFNTSDGVIYTINNLSLNNGGLKFRQDNDWPNNWGGNTWPSGTGIFNQDGVDVQAVQGIYNVTFNRTTLEYSFVQIFPSVGVLGSATAAGWDGPDIDMETTDGIVYTLNNTVLTDGGLKFRLDDQWPNNWGGTAWPSGTAIFNQNGVDIPCTAGIYNISFNLNTLAYNFEAVTAGVNIIAKEEISILPNPASDIVTLSYKNINAGAVAFYDVSGKCVLQSVVRQQTNFNVSGFVPGVYIVKINTSTGCYNIKFIKN